MQRKPFFYDITLRDGNQALKKPWNIAEKEIVFNKLVELGVQAVEVGFSASSDMDFGACAHLAKIAPQNVVISGLARAVEGDIIKVARAIEPAEKRRIHTFITLSPFHMKYVLNKSPQEVRKIAAEAVEFAKKEIGTKGEVQFSVEHFGDCAENIDWVVEVLKDVVKAGATTINLPNTVERSRPYNFIRLIEKAYEALPKDITLSLHNHNDLGMATATTVEGYFCGATQLECSLNGLGERAGNTNMFEVAVALYNSGVEVPLDMTKIYETALLISEMSNVAVPEKAPLIGPDALAHRSGIHQDGAIKTKDMEKGAYRPINPALIGRKDDEHIGFTSQSGKTAVFEIISKAGYPITIAEAIRITPSIKELAQKVGELAPRQIIDIYFKEVFHIGGAFKFESLQFVKSKTFKLNFKHKDESFEIEGHGNGPLDACLDALKNAGFSLKLLSYKQEALDDDLLGSGATAMSVIEFETLAGEPITVRGRDESTYIANAKAVFNGLNLIYKE